MFNSEVRDDIKDVAEQYGIEPEKLMAVAWVESGGVPYWTVDGQNVPVIRYEGHYAYRYLRDNEPDRLQEAVTAGLANPKVGGIRNPGSAERRYALYRRAAAFDKYMAIYSTSYGVGQVMGAHWKSLGFSKIEDLEKSAMTVKGQVDLMVRFIEFAGLSAALRKGDWKTFAKGYNGPAYAMNKYDVRMREAYNTLIKERGKGRNAEIVLVQQKLVKLGYYIGFPNGEDDEKYRNALKRFQGDNGLETDGIAGPLTMSEIEEDLSDAETQQAPKALGFKAGVGTAGAASATTVYEIISQTHDSTAQISDILTTANAKPFLFTIAIGGLVGYAVYRAAKHIVRKYRIVRVD